jgi:carboxypeptidase Taq
VAQKQSQPIPPAPLPSSAYDRLRHVFDAGSDLLQTAGGILDWIHLTHALPQVSDTVIDEAKAAAEIFMHRNLSQPAVKQWIGDVRAHSGDLDAIARRNFALMEKLWQESAGLDEGFVNDLSLACSVSQRVWEQTQPGNDFAAWLPHFEEVVKLMHRKGEALGGLSGDTPYQALLGSAAFNSGLRNETVNAVFDELRARLPALIQSVMEKQAAGQPPLPLPAVPVDDQRRVARLMMRVLGLEEAYGRLDESAHPFSTGQWDDVRITTRYREDDMLSAVTGVVHETGHALYSRGLPKQWKGQPIGEAQSMWVHETQSLFWEKQVAGSREFMEYLSAVIKEELKLDDPAWGADNLYKRITRVQPSLIRVDADEVTYPAHIILRHDLEQKLIDGTLASKDVPDAWNRCMRDLLGVEVPDYAQGCMQDTHWPSGLIGYFPAYSFGALGAAQLMERARRDIPGIGERIRTGDFAPIRAWLADRIHRHGSRYSGEELMEKATGKPLSADAWLNHIQKRYLDTEVSAH